MSVGVFSEYHFALQSLAVMKTEVCTAQCLAYCLVCSTFGVLEYIGFLAFTIQFWQFYLVWLLIGADSQCKVEVGAEVVGHRIAIIEVIRHHKVADILHHLLGSVGESVIVVNVVVVYIVVEHYAFFLLECLETTFACGLVNSATNLLCHFLWQDSKIPTDRCFDLRNNLYFCTQILKELFEKRDEYGSARQSYFFLSIANSHVSSS